MKAQDPVVIHGLLAADLAATLARLPETARQYATAAQFTAGRGDCLLAPDATGNICAVLLGLGKERTEDDAWLCGKLPGLLPDGHYHLGAWEADPLLSAVAFGLGAYRFDRYGKPGRKPVFLTLADQALEKEALRIIDAVSLGRDLVNTPASDLGPEALHEAATACAQRFGGSIDAIVGEDLLKRNFPMIYAVGKASAQAPRLLDLRFGDPAHPRVTLVGKGVCFDTGGLDIKPSSAMLLMKKDMGGAATALAAATMICDARLPVHLRVLLPVVENAIAGNALRPGDILQSRKGLTVEIGNTDAEGRLILADALSYACEEEPALLMGFATLTGAARVALGPEIPPFYTHNDALGSEIAEAARRASDPVWRMPLWAPYQGMIDSKIADVNNSGGSPFAGSITAALFLSRFVPATALWAHFDIYAWNPATRPGRPEGGEVQAARLVYAMLKSRYRQKQ